MSFFSVIKISVKMSRVLYNKRTLLTIFHKWIPLRCMCSREAEKQLAVTNIQGKTYPIDEWTNITPSIINKIGTNLHTNVHNPIGLIKLQIQQYFYKSFVKRGNPLFSVYDNFHPVVTLEQNFDNLLVEKDHVSRNRSESYYLNSMEMLRAHTTAHQRDLIQSGLDAFLIVGDVYRRDTVDASHYPVFHQLDAVRLFTRHELFDNVKGKHEDLKLFDPDNSFQTPFKQSSHALEAALTLESGLKSTLINLAHSLFGEDIETKWVEAYFPFTHPSWELEIKYQDKWLEVLGCGVIQQQILNNSGAGDKVGWAFGMGLERLAMKLYDIPDVRLFWSTDTAFTSQFKVDDPFTKIKFKPFSKHPQCINDLSFWITDSFHENDLYDIVRSIGGDLVENVELFDTFFHPKKQRTSHAYRLTYRHMEKALAQEEVNVVHQKIEDAARETLGVEIR